MTLNTKKSLWSVLAVLALLPASRSLVGVIMLARFKSLTKAEYDDLSAAAGDIPALYETVLTTSERSYFLPVIIYSQNTLTALVNTKGADQKAVREHLEGVLKSAGHSAVVRLFDDKESFFRRLKEIKDRSSGDERVRAENVFNTIKAVSL